MNERNERNYYDNTKATQHERSEERQIGSNRIILYILSKDEIGVQDVVRTNIATCEK